MIKALTRFSTFLILLMTSGLASAEEENTDYDYMAAYAGSFTDSLDGAYMIGGQAANYVWESLPFALFLFMFFSFAGWAFYLLSRRPDKTIESMLTVGLIMILMMPFTDTVVDGGWMENLLVKKVTTEDGTVYYENADDSTNTDSSTITVPVVVAFVHNLLTMLTDGLIGIINDLLKAEGPEGTSLWMISQLQQTQSIDVGNPTIQYAFKTYKDYVNGCSTAAAAPDNPEGVNAYNNVPYEEFRLLGLLGGNVMGINSNERIRSSKNALTYLSSVGINGRYQTYSTTVEDDDGKKQTVIATSLAPPARGYKIPTKAFWMTHFSLPESERQDQPDETMTDDDFMNYDQVIAEGFWVYNPLDDDVLAFEPSSKKVNGKAVPFSKSVVKDTENKNGSPYYFAPLSCAGLFYLAEMTMANYYAGLGESKEYAGRSLCENTRSRADCLSNIKYKYETVSGLMAVSGHNFTTSAMAYAREDGEDRYSDGKSTDNLSGWTIGLSATKNALDSFFAMLTKLDLPFVISITIGLISLGYLILLFFLPVSAIISLLPGFEGRFFIVLKLIVGAHIYLLFIYMSVKIGGSLAEGLAAVSQGYTDVGYNSLKYVAHMGAAINAGIISLMAFSLWVTHILLSGSFEQAMRTFKPNTGNNPASTASAATTALVGGAASKVMLGKFIGAMKIPGASQKLADSSTQAGANGAGNAKVTYGNDTPIMSGIDRKLGRGGKSK